jgi:hypothetical protein
MALTKKVKLRRRSPKGQSDTDLAKSFRKSRSLKMNLLLKPKLGAAKQLPLVEVAPI